MTEGAHQKVSEIDRHVKGLLEDATIYIPSRNLEKRMTQLLRERKK